MASPAHPKTSLIPNIYLNKACATCRAAGVQEATKELAAAQDALSAAQVEKQLLADRLEALQQVGVTQDRKSVV